MQEEITRKMDPEGMLKGRMAETLVEELLKKSGNTVYRFGYEAIMQNLVQIKRIFDAHNEVGEQIRTIPDFIVIEEKGEPFFVEVKFRWDGNMFDDKDKALLGKIKHFWNAKIIFVNSVKKPFFQVSSSPYLDESGNLICKPVSEEKSWKIDLETYENVEALVEKYLSQSLKLN